jgi:NAD/NADP transhydrogenase beta subunit
MSANVSNLLYLVAGILFILALRGLSHPTTCREHVKMSGLRSTSHVRF